MKPMQWEKLLNPMRARTLLTEDRSSSKSSTDTRSEFQRDYGRAVFSTTVRRLQDKAQVFPLDPSDFVRTRLTHSLEVSTLCRSLVGAVRSTLSTKAGLDSSSISDVEEIAATCGLLHDIGNPPFGHSGEVAISDWFDELVKGKGRKLPTALGGKGSATYQDFARFEGNAQTLRLVSRLQVLADRFGLNLTVGTLSALMKYVASSNQKKTGQSTKKPGFFQSELPLVKKLRSVTGTGQARNPIAFLVEAADDMVYSTVDLEDGIKKKVIDWSAVKENITDKALLKECEKYIKKLGSRLTGAALDDALIQIFRTRAMYQHVDAAAAVFNDRYDEIMKGEVDKELLEVGQSAQLVLDCKRLAATQVYPHSEILKRELAGRSAIKGLLSLFWEGARNAPDVVKKSFDEKLYRLMSGNYRRVFEEDQQTTELPIEYHRLQLVTDYVCGMTDSFALGLHTSLHSR